MKKQTVTDQMIYIVIEGHLGGSYLPERNVSELDRKTTVKDIAEAQWDDVLQVIECSPAEHACLDVTKDIALDVSEVWADRGEPLADWQLDFIERHLGIETARHFRRAA